MKEIGDIFGSGKLRHYVETLGGRGSRIYTRQEAGKIAVTSVEAISPSAREAETIGAGDGYVSGFMYGYINGMDIETCAGYGSKDIILCDRKRRKYYESPDTGTNDGAIS